MSIAISMKFLESFSRLPDSIKKRTIEFLEKFEANPQASGFNYESIAAVYDKKLKSVRINDTYRAIVKREDETGTYILLWVDHHDEAYDWATTRRCEVNPVTGRIQLFSVDESGGSVCVTDHTNQTLFGNISESDLIKIGVPKPQIGMVKAIKDLNTFLTCRHLLPEDVADNLEWIANDIPIEEIIEMVAQEKPDKAIGDLGEALRYGNSSNEFVIIDGQEELRSVMNSSMEKWRVFLHPSQKEVVEKNYSGPARVLGEAGTGKTVVAMHRAKRLASTITNGKRILFTTFTVNLAEDIKDNLKKICSNEEYSRIDVVSLDAWVSRYLQSKSERIKLIYGKELDKYWVDAISLSGEVEFDKDFFREEWITVIAGNEVSSYDDYIQASRIGRGTRLNRAQKARIWSVIEKYIELTERDGVVDFETAMIRCRKLLVNSDNDDLYSSVIVDEGQDFNSNAYSLIRAIAGNEHSNDIFIVGDAHQRIYRRKAVLSKCGINIKGRSSHLRINYRTTEEIRKYAYSVLTGISFDDLDGNEDKWRESRSFMHGPKPIIKNYPNIDDESEYISEEIKSILDKGVDAKDICLVARTGKQVDGYATKLQKKGIRTYEIKQTKKDDRSLDGIRIATMHRVKGLEFDYLFLAGANKGIIPLDTAIDHTDVVTERETITAEKCLVYVALTRTRKCAYITSFGKKSDILP